MRHYVQDMTDHVEAAVESTEKRMRLRYAGTCARCGAALEAKAWAFYDRASKTVRCVECPGEPVASPGADSLTVEPTAPTVRESTVLEAEPVLDVSDGIAGGSALREYERRSAAREERVRAEHPRIGGLLLAMFDDPQSTRAWASGAMGEQRLGEMLAKVTGPTLRILHDRRIPGSRANIDHIVVCPAGVFVVDAKRYRDKRPELRVEGGWLRPRVETLLVGGRDRTSLVDGVLKQVGLVVGALADELGAPVRGVLCFVDGDWPLIGGAFSTRDVDVVWPRKLAAMLATPGPLDETAIAALHQRLARAFPPA